MFIIVTKYLIPKGYYALTVYPFVILSNASLKENKVLLNHEKIHLKQQLELLVFPFFVWYLIEYLVRLAKFKNHSTAYRNISFEREAYFNEKNLKYNEKRKSFGFLCYIVK